MTFTSELKYIRPLGITSTATGTSQTTVSNIQIGNYAPDIKVIDFYRINKNV